MSFTDRKPFTVSAEDTKRRWGGGFHCKLCGHRFSEGDIVRWIFANGTPGATMGNFFVCQKDDGDDATVIERAIESFSKSVKLAKQWNIYGPDWQRDFQENF